MFLAAAIRDCPDELLADFQQTYRIDLWAVEWWRIGDAQAAHLAALAYQLPHDGRVWTAIEPTQGNGLVARLLRLIEYNQRVWHWAHTEDAKNKETAPEPTLLPGEEAAYERSVADAKDDAARTAEAFGIEL